MAIFQLFISGIADLFDSHIKIQILACQRVVTIHSDYVVTNGCYGHRNAAALTCLSFKLHADFNAVHALASSQC